MEQKACVKCGSQMIYDRGWTCEPCLTEVVNIKRKMLEEASAQQAIIGGTKMKKCDECGNEFLTMTIIPSDSSIKYLCTNCLSYGTINGIGTVISIEGKEDGILGTVSNGQVSRA